MLFELDENRLLTMELGVAKGQSLPLETQLRLVKALQDAYQEIDFWEQNHVLQGDDL